MLFLTADDETLVKRYKETRRSHPIYNPNGLLASIKQERTLLEKLYNSSDFVIDTSHLSNSGLLDELKEIFCDDNKKTFVVNVMAFGYKYGMPMDADLVFDVRCFPNPFYIDELKYKTGNDKEVQDYVMQFPEAQEFEKKLFDMMDFLIPLYEEEGKVSITIAIGCTGGKHRSVTFTNKLGEHLKETGLKVNVAYRDMGRE